MLVIKRDMRVKKYEEARIFEAIKSAYVDVYNSPLSADVIDDIYDIVMDVNEDIENMKKEKVTVEEIQDIVVKNIKQYDELVANAYQRYREERSKKRENKGYLNTEIEGIFNQTSEEIRNNANKDGSKLHTLRAMIADVAVKDYAKRNVVPAHLLERHEKSLYIHDMNYMGLPMFNCMLINWIDMLENGFVIAGKTIESPKSITTAIALLSQIVAHVSSNCYGGVTLPKLTALKTYVKRSYDKHYEVGLKWLQDEEKAKEYALERVEKECYDSAQAFEYECQTLTNSRGEVPFLTIELDCGDENATLEEEIFERMIIKSFLTMRLNGLTGGKTATFPKIVFETKKGVNLNPEDKYYDLFQLAVKCSSVRLYPDYINYDKCVEVTGGYKPPMSCRSFLGEYINSDGEREIFGRFNQGVCSVNLPRLAIMAKGNEDDFYKLLEQELEYAKEVLMIRHNLLKGVRAEQAPILYMSGAVCRKQPNETIDDLLFGGYSSISIGYVGLHNTMIMLYGKSFYESDDYMDKAEKIMQFIRDFCEKAKKETNIGFSMYSTPFEVGATKLCKADVRDFGVIDGVNDKGYYENSFHFPSDQPIKPFEKIDIESRFSKIASGGGIQYIEAGNMIHNVKALETVIKYSYDKCHYFAVNVASDRCYECGFVGEIQSTCETETEYECPQCGNTDKHTMSIVRRLCGYISDLDERSTIDNKLKEINHRHKHIK